MYSLASKENGNNAAIAWSRAHIYTHTDYLIEKYCVECIRKGFQSLIFINHNHLNRNAKIGYSRLELESGSEMIMVQK